MSKDGLTATVYGISVAVEYNPDGSIIICKELVDEILAEPDLPEFVRRVLTCNRPDDKRFGEPVVIHKVE